MAKCHLGAALSGALLCAAWCGLAARAGAEPLSLDQAVRLALQNNERTKIAQDRVDQAVGDVESARAPFLPSVSLGSSAKADGYPDGAGRYLTSSGTLSIKQSIFAPSA